jgi:L-arabinokinase
MPSYLHRIVFYISGHGFGHASRSIEVIESLLRAAPRVEIIVKSSAPKRLFDRTLAGRVEVIDFECDTGMVQSDSLHIDERESFARAAAFYADFDAKVDTERRFLVSVAASCVVGDIPPLAFAAAAAAGLPSIGIGNFTWDWIYEGFPEYSPGAIADTIRRGYQHATQMLRLPMSGGFERMSAIEDIPFIARRSVRDPAEVRAALGVVDHRPLVLLSFGAYGLHGLDTRALGAMTDYAVVETDLTIEQRLYAAGFRYEDLVGAADVVVTKPGYGIISECIANGTSMLYTSRGRFREYELLVREMPKYLRAVFIEQADLLAGRWQTGLDEVLALPPPPFTAATNGAAIAASRILSLNAETRRR